MNGVMTNIIEISKKLLNKIRYFGKLKYLEVHLAEHCNLNCAYCSHNCPVAEPKFPNIEQFERDFQKLSELTGGYIKNLRLLGGEPLLNPEINQLIEIARRNIPYSNIQVVTNGILLTKMKEDFWIACKNNNISINLSQYPIKIDVSKIREISKQYGVNVFSESQKSRKHKDDIFWNQKFDMQGKYNPQKSYNNCIVNFCTFLKDGKIYVCAQIPCSAHLEKTFGVKFSISEKDYLVLDKINNVKEILKFISLSSPFCRYCDCENRQLRPWKQSARAKEEWIV